MALLALSPLLTLLTLTTAEPAALEIIEVLPVAQPWLSNRWCNTCAQQIIIYTRYLTVYSTFIACNLDKTLTHICLSVFAALFVGGQQKQVKVFFLDYIVSFQLPLQIKGRGAIFTFISRLNASKTDQLELGKPYTLTCQAPSHAQVPSAQDS